MMIMEIFSVKFWLYLISGDCICQIVKAAIEEKRVMRLWFPVLVTTCEVFDLLNLCSACVLLTFFDWKFSILRDIFKISHVLLWYLQIVGLLSL